LGGRVWEEKELLNKEDASLFTKASIAETLARE